MATLSFSMEKQHNILQKQHKYITLDLYSKNCHNWRLRCSVPTTFLKCIPTSKSLLNPLLSFRTKCCGHLGAIYALLQLPSSVTSGCAHMDNTALVTCSTAYYCSVQVCHLPNSDLVVHTTQASRLCLPTSGVDSPPWQLPPGHQWHPLLQPFSKYGKLNILEDSLATSSQQTWWCLHVQSGGRWQCLNAQSGVPATLEVVYFCLSFDSWIGIWLNWKWPDGRANSQ